MTGLDKIIKPIAEEASSVAQQKIKAAEVEAKNITDAAREEAEKQAAAVLNNSDADCKNYRERVKSRADFQKRTEILKAKQALISDVIEKAYQEMVNADDTSYFEYIEKMLEEFIRPEEGIICFSKKDLARLPFGFKAKVKMIAAKKSGSLKVSDEAGNIEGGFLLIYGGIEENCTFRALFDTKQEQLVDRVHEFLFS